MLAVALAGEQYPNRIQTAILRNPLLGSPRNKCELLGLALITLDSFYGPHACIL